jgi:type IV secretory pathway VirB10-like protein
MQCQLRSKWRFLAVVIGAGIVAAAGAQTYKWKDAEGKIHYSDQPPPANIKEPVTVQPRKGQAPAAPTEKGAAAPKDKAAPPAKPRTYVEEEAERKKRQVETAEREAAEKKKADDAAEKKRNCDLALAQVKSLQSGGRVTRNNAQGEREYLSDAQTAQEIERAKKSADSWCK